ncbi:MAG: trigger factor [Akkermansiaceae bacterium]|nr:trigger factor [Akkermansiaceae bacterium]
MIESRNFFCNFLTLRIMEITINKTSDCQVELKATVPAADVTAIQDGIIKSISGSARIPGFRPGKAPKSVIVKRYASDIKDELDARLRSDIQDKCLEENPELKVLDFGDIQSGVQEDGSYTLTSKLTVVPEFELPEYMGIEVSVPSTEVSEAEVDETLAKYAETSARHEVTERASAQGDVVVIDFKTTVEGKPTAEYCGKPVGFMEGREDYWVTLEEDRFMPELAAGLVGVSAGESKDITASLKADFPISDLAGKEVVFHCTVKEVREKLVPEVNEELFATALPGKTMAEIRDMVRENLKGNKERSNDEAKADQISEKLADQLTFALPTELVERENENTVQRKIYAALQSGNYEATKNTDALREEAMKETERNLRVYFALQEIAHREHVVATDQEMLEAISNMAKQARENNLKSFIRKLQREGRMTGVRLSIITSKVLDLLARNAKVTVTE